jgi:tripartite-type tricarboxylate transporter receptor subunit TctC
MAFLALTQTRRRFALALCALGAASALHAQTPAAAAWPAKPIRIVVGFAPGGGTDVLARVLGQALSESLGQSVVIDNKVGASGNIAASEVIRATPDGYTFMVGPTSVETVNPSIIKSPLLLSRDLTPVGGVGKTQMYLIAKPQSENKNVRDLVAQAKAQPGHLSCASAGSGTPPHLACALFNLATGASIMHVPYRGSAPALQDVVAGQADFVFDPGLAFQYVRTGKAKLLGVMSDRRSPFFPDVATVAEQGFPGATLDIWFGLWAPNGTPPEILERMNREMNKALAQPAIKTRYAELGAEPAPLTMVEFKSVLTKEGEMLTKLIKDQKISVD